MPGDDQNPSAVRWLHLPSIGRDRFNLFKHLPDVTHPARNPYLEVGGGCGYPDSTGSERELDACGQTGVRAQALAQRGHEVPLDHVQKDAGDRVLPVEQLLERFAWQDQQQ